jgi:5-methylcytosine-specific restriction enzyme A
MRFVYDNQIRLANNDILCSGMTFEPKLELGYIIDNQDLCELFKCRPQGGMRRSHKTNSLVLISDRTKGIYFDKCINGVLHYVGMG